MQYFRGAALELPPEGPDTAPFLFFSSAASQDFMMPSWSMAALASYCMTGSGRESDDPATK
jgi:hypothetical protein